MQHGVTVTDLGKRFRRYSPDRPRSLKGLLARGFRRHPRPAAFWALRNVSFNVSPGEMLGVIGSNGSGKSTLLKLIGGVMWPDEGRLDVRGRVRALLELGTGFHPELSGRENIYIGGVVAGLLRRDVEARFDDIVAFAEIEDFLDSPLRTYSSGMKLRLGFSVAVHSDPEVLLIDEVLTVGDLAFQYKCLDRIRQYQEAGCAIVLVSHDLDQVSRLCDRVLWLRKGEAYAFGPPDVVIGQYRAAMTSETRRRLPSDHPARRTAGGAELRVGENRFGSLEMEITAVRLLDEQSRPVSILDGGEALTIEIDYEAAEPIETAIFCVTISGDDQAVIDLASDADNVAVPTIEGAGTIRLHIDRLDLAGGRYFVDVGAFEKEWTYAYDYHWHVYPLLIESKNIGQSILLPPRRWEYDGSKSESQWSTERKSWTLTS